MSTLISQNLPSLTTTLNYSNPKSKSKSKSTPFLTTSLPIPSPSINPTLFNSLITTRTDTTRLYTPAGIGSGSVIPELEPVSLKSRLQNGDTLYGLFLCSSSPTMAEIAGHAGYDFVVVDMEHGHGGIPEALTCLRALAGTNTPAILRLPETTATWAKKALDIGPQGIMFPMIESHKDARKAVSYCRYPPNGVRGAAHPIVRASGYGVDAGGYLGSCEEDLLIMCQVESKDAVEKVDEIAGVDGVDCIQMGPLDLSASMGYLWDPGNKKVMQTLHKLEKAVLKAKDGGKKGVGAYLCGFSMPHDGPLELKKRGYHMITGGVDIAMFRSALVDDVNKFKTSLEVDNVDDVDDADGRMTDPKDGDDKYWSE